VVVLVVFLPVFVGFVVVIVRLKRGGDITVPTHLPTSTYLPTYLGLLRGSFVFEMPYLGGAISTRIACEESRRLGLIRSRHRGRRYVIFILFDLASVAVDAAISAGD